MGNTEITGATVTLFRRVSTPKEPHYATVGQCLDRIRSGRFASVCQAIRDESDGDIRNEIKKNELPGVCWSGKFSARYDKDLVAHNGFMVLDFDDVPATYREVLQADPHTFACWLSPSGNGFKVLIRIADPLRHRQHFAHIKKHLWKDADGSGVNESRFCYESYDPELYVNEAAKIYDKVLEQETYTYIENRDTLDDFEKIMRWLSKRGNAFAKGSRNDYIFILAGACCRFGMHVSDCEANVRSRILTTEPSFKIEEANQAIRSGYKQNATIAGSARFDTRQRLVTTQSSKEVTIEQLEPERDENGRYRDIIYSSDVKAQGHRIRLEGYGSADTFGMDELGFKIKSGEVTLLSGFANHGKSQLLKAIQLCDILANGQRWVNFNPEEFPAGEYYHDFVEMHEGHRINPESSVGISEARYDEVHDFIGQYVMFQYPKGYKPNTDDIISLWLKLHVELGIRRFSLDPHNKLTRTMDSNSSRDDLYLQEDLDKFNRFARETDSAVIIVAHPKHTEKTDGKNMNCPNVDNIKGGQTWDAMMDNILIYHRPFKTSDPLNPTSEFHRLKIKRQKIVGKPGMMTLEYDFNRNRFTANGRDFIADLRRAKEPPQPFDPFRVIPDINKFQAFWNDTN